MQVGEALSLGVRRDFTFVHPEVLEERCTVDGAALALNNTVNHERWRAFIIPSSRCINVATMRRIKKFYDQGGMVIATTRLPDSAAEPGADDEVRRLVTAIFGTARVSASSTWAGNGYEPALSMDGSLQTRWNAASDSRGPQWLELDLGDAKTGADAVVDEAFERVRGYRLQSWDGAAWIDLAKGDRLGTHKEITFAPVSAPKIRLLMEAVVSDNASISEWTLRGVDGRDLFERKPAACHRNAKGGKAWFLPSPNVAALNAVLDEALPDGDVVIGQDLTTSGGNFSYIHKVKDGRSLVLLANSSDGAVDTWVSLRGKLVPEIWNPHDGKMGPSEYEHVAGKVGTVTRVHVKLPPVRSMFLVATFSVTNEK